MASRKEQKEQARAARIAQEQEAAAKQQRTRRLQIFGGVIVAAVIVIVVAIVVSSGGSNAPKGATPGLSHNPQLVAQVDAMLHGIPQNGSTLGDPHAPVTMDYFGDLECPVCQDFTLNVFPQFVQQDVRTGKVKVVYRSMCTATCGGNYSQAQSMANFNKQQVAALAAGKQSKAWNYIELFYHQQKQEDTGYANDAFLTGLAHQTTGLNVSTWKTDRTDPSLQDSVNADGAYATKANLPGTPSLIMKGSKGETLVNGGQSIPTVAQLEAAAKSVS